MRLLQMIVSGLLLSAARVATAEPQIFTVSGQVVSSSGAPLQGKDHFMLIGHDEGNGFLSATSRIDEDGSFHCDLPPGRYLLTAGSFLGPDGDVKPLDERGFAAVTVGRADVPSVVIRTHPRIRVRGRVRYDAEGFATTYPSVQIFSAPAFEGLGVGAGEESARFGPDGTFELVVGAVPVVIRNGYALAGRDMWWPGPVLLDGRDITDVPTDFSRTHGELEVVFTQRPIGLFGIVTDDATQLSVENASVIVVSAEPARREPWADGTRLIVADSDGHFWKSLSPGEYLAVAFPAGAIESPSVAFRNLDAFVKLATPFTIDPARRGAQLHLTLSRLPALRRQSP